MKLTLATLALLPIFALSCRSSAPPEESRTLEEQLSYSGRLSAGQSLRAGDSVVSGSTSLVFQGDGNLVLYQGGQALWATMRLGSPSSFAMQRDCNAVAYSTGGVLWHASTHGQGADCSVQVVAGDWMVCSGSTAVFRARGIGTCSSGTQPPGGYQGCFTDSSSRALPAFQGAGFDNNSCRSSCASQGYAYAGTQYYGQCFCGNALGYQRTGDQECNTPCSANGSQMCGGPWRNSIYATGSTPPAGDCPGGSGPVLAGGGDVVTYDSYSRTNAQLTGDLMRCLQRKHGADFKAFTTGDNEQGDGSYQAFMDNYDPRWGSFKSITYAARGNHDNTSGFAAYFNHLPNGGRWYAYDHGTWRFIVLNSEEPFNGDQNAFLEAELSANQGRCVGVYFHKPRWTSGGVNAPNTEVNHWWQMFVQYRADLVMSGHNHQLERFTHMGPDGIDGAGPRQFVTGTGGYALYGWGAIQPGSEIRRNDAHGIFKLYLRPDGYRWEWIGIGPGYPVLESGSHGCQ